MITGNKKPTASHVNDVKPKEVAQLDSEDVFDSDESDDDKTPEPDPKPPET